MRVAVLADDSQWQELVVASANVQWIRCLNEKEFFECAADIYINVMEDAFTKNYTLIIKPVLINSVSNTLKEINAGINVLRFNGWSGFLARQNWEVAGEVNDSVKDFFLAINKNFTTVPDEPGMIAARIISMIINEAYFALEEKLSTKEEIDIAMKLGTNYPYGPFEWADKIGAKNIYVLLQKLSTDDKRYLPAPLLQKQATL
jgi:3-hydroxybutyryl-CoA dehydrogenase